jgi:hypothetical protein
MERREKLPRRVANSANVGGAVEVSLAVHVFDEFVELEVRLDVVDVLEVVLEIIDEVVVLVVEVATELDVIELAPVELLLEVATEVVEAEEVLVDLEAVGPWASST